MLFRSLKSSVDKIKAAEYFEKIEGESIPQFKVNMMVDDLLRKFVLEGGFDIKMPDGTNEYNELIAEKQENYNRD